MVQQILKVRKMALFKKSEPEFTKEEMDLIQQKRTEDMKKQEEEAEEISGESSQNDFWSDLSSVIETHSETESPEDMLISLEMIKIELLKLSIKNETTGKK